MRERRHQTSDNFFSMSIQLLKSSARHMASPHFDSLDRERLEQSIGRTLNETDWKVLN